MSRKKKNNKSKFIFPRNAFTLDHRVIDHPDYIILPDVAKVLLHDMCRLYNGFNNGDISIPYSEMQKRGWSEGRLERGKRPLLKHDWIRLTRIGKGKYRPCHLYALSWIPLDECKDKLEISINSFEVRDLK